MHISSTTHCEVYNVRDVGFDSSSLGPGSISAHFGNDGYIKVIGKTDSFFHVHWKRSKKSFFEFLGEILYFTSRIV